MSNSFTYNPFAVDGPGRAYRSLSVPELWRIHLETKKDPNVWKEIKERGCDLIGGCDVTINIKNQ